MSLRQTSTRQWISSFVDNGEFDLGNGQSGNQWEIFLMRKNVGKAEEVHSD